MRHASYTIQYDRQRALERGAAIYGRVCANCHGTLEAPGSLPTAPRFASHTFKSGADPLSLYRTLTVGAGQMVPQGWMVPSQKYDVIHYLRETFLKGHNDKAHVAITPDYLAALRRAGVPFSLHVYETGPHGLGLGRPEKPAPPWGDQLLYWFKERKFIR